MNKLVEMTKVVKYLFLFVALVTLATSCTKDEELVGGSTEGVQLRGQEYESVLTDDISGDGPSALPGGFDNDLQITDDEDDENDDDGSGITDDEDDENDDDSSKKK